MAATAMTDTRTAPGEPLAPATFEGAWKSQHIGKKLSGFTFTIDGNYVVEAIDLAAPGRPHPHEDPDGGSRVDDGRARRQF